MSIDNMFQCDCGSKIKKTSLYKHKKSKKHVFYIQHKDLPDCAICLENKITSYSFQCDTCKNSHCSQCHPKMDKCPFCRASFYSLPAFQDGPVSVEQNTEYTLLWRRMVVRLDTLALFAERGILFLIQNYREEIQQFREMFPHFVNYFRQDLQTYNKFSYLLNFLNV